MNAGPDTTTGAGDAEALDSLLDALVDDGAAPLAPIRFGPYTLHERIGEGGMGIVYRASRDGLPGFLALKSVPALFATPTAVARMRREAEILGRLDIPGVVRIIESGIARTDLGEQPFIAMDLIEGEHIDRFVRRTNATPTAVIALVRSLCSIIEQAHRAGVVHRDLKPSNVLVDEHGGVRVLDFGVARADNTLRTRLTRTGDRIGTPGYMSPEQQRGEPAGPPADVYAIACLTRTLLRSAERRGTGGSRRVDRAIEWGTRPRDEQRCPSPAAFSDAIAGNAPPRGRSHRRTRNAAALIATALALSTTSLGTTRPGDPEPAPPRAAVLLSTDAALSDRERTNLDTEYAQIGRIETMTDGEITALSASDEVGTMSRRLADALGLACWSRGMEGVAPVFFGAAFVAGEREGLGKTQPTWHRQVQLHAESRIRIGEHGTAIAILDAATSQTGTTARRPTPVASNIRSAVLRLWWTRAWAMHKQGETGEARALLETILDAQHTAYPDHTDWLDSLDALTQILAEQGQGAAGVINRYAVPVGIDDGAIHERWARIAPAPETCPTPAGR